MSLRDSIKSIWDVALSNSVLHNTAKIITLDQKLGSLIPELYGTKVYSTYDRSPPAIDFYRIPHCHRQKHRVTRLEINRSGEYKYFLETGLITLQDKLVCSFLGWPFTLLEALVCLLAVPLALAATVLLTAICILAAIPFLLWNHGISYTGIKDLGFTYGFLFAIVPVGLAMASYRLFQAVFRIPVGIVLLIKAKLFDLEEEPLKTAQTLMNKTPEQIKALGIEVIDNRIVHQNQSVRSASASASRNEFNSDNNEAKFQLPLFPSVEDIENLYPVEIPDRYQCPISMDLMSEPVLLNDGHFYDENELVKIPNFSKSPKTNQNLVNGNTIQVLSFTKELKAFADAIETERTQSKPNYQPILDLAKEAEKTAGNIRTQITRWIQLYTFTRQEIAKLDKQLKEFKPEEQSENNNLYQLLKKQQEAAHKTQSGLIAEITKDENNYNCINKAINIGVSLSPEFETNFKNVVNAVCQISASPQINSAACFFSLHYESDIPNSMKECLIKALQEAMMETHNFPEKFAALTGECIASPASLLFEEII